MYQQNRLMDSTLAVPYHGQVAPPNGAATVSLKARRTAPITYRRRYADVADRHLADQLASEDAAVEAGKSPFDRLTCPAHRRWLHQCIASPQHVLPVTGHRWCRDCQTPVTVAVDELAGEVSLACPRCHRAPDGIATRQIVRACRASLASDHQTHRGTDDARQLARRLSA